MSDSVKVSNLQYAGPPVATIRPASPFARLSASIHLVASFRQPIRSVAILSFLALAACATPEPRVSTITNTVQIPVPTPCLAADQIPPKPAPTPVDVDRATTDQIVAATVADLTALDQYAAIADPLLRQCAKQ